MTWEGYDSTLLLACADSHIRRYLIDKNTVLEIGQHSKAVKDVFYYNEGFLNRIVVSGGWDSLVKFWTLDLDSQSKL